MQAYSVFFSSDFLCAAYQNSTKHTKQHTSKTLQPYALLTIIINSERTLFFLHISLDSTIKFVNKHHNLGEYSFAHFFFVPFLYTNTHSKLLFPGSTKKKFLKKKKQTKKTKKKLPLTCS